MKNSGIRNTLLALFLALLNFSIQSCRSNHDADIQSAIDSQTQTNSDLAGVSATVVNGVVTLTGNCPDEDCRKNAEKAIKKIDGVTHITNNIIIAATTDIAPDNELREASKKIAERYKGVEAGVNGGVITLRGEIKKDKLQQLMMDMNALRPKRIDNQLAVK